jgi:hypothetical protein
MLTLAGAVAVLTGLPLMYHVTLAAGSAVTLQLKVTE